MATIEKTVTIRQCDFCDSDEDCHHKCDGCGKDFCYDCMNDATKIVEYRHALCVSGSGDGHYCLECDKKFEDDPLHISYLVLKDLIDHRKQYIQTTDKQAKEVESRIRSLRKERGL